MKRTSLSGFLSGIVLVAGCVSTGGPTYPILEQTADTDASLSCEALDGDFHAASSLRSEIIEAHGDAITDAVKDTAIDAVRNPANAVMSGIMKSAKVSGQTKHYAEAAAAAGNRMEQILRYKREKDCAEIPTRDPSLTDDDVLTLLDEALARFEAGEIDEKEYVLQRAKLLDKMRYVKY